uniref:Phosphatidylserine synthase n=1 Tax=Phallusia mammillata TaxID=59560 RepID=A0A6F9DP86_9ASCI|nr:phosphatidylserine synthase 2-like [Phallusia mammillata]
MLETSTHSVHKKNNNHSKGRRESESLVYDDGTNTFFWRAHTISVLVFGVIALVYVVFIEDQSDDREFNTKRGIIASVLVFLAFGITQAKDGPFIRPHPAFWRLMLCISVLYELGLVFLLFQSVSDARFMLTYIDPKLNQALDFRAYGGECTLWDPGHPNGPLHNFVDKLDGFVIAHFLGWFFKALILRDIWLTNCISIAFELLEYTFEHQLPNFSECWWDHWIMDFLICNGLGIYLGMQCLKHLSAKEYKWHGLWNISSYRGKMRRVVSQFSPYSWVKFKWQPTENLFRWLFVLILTMMFLLAELNTFYLKFVLWVPPDHPIVLGRLIAYLPWGAVAVRESYDYAGGTAKKFGQQAWMISAIIITEFLIVVKFGSDVLSTPFPAYIQWFWLVVLLTYIVYTIWKFQMKFPRFKRWFQVNVEHKKIETSSASELSDGWSDQEPPDGVRKRVTLHANGNPSN